MEYGTVRLIARVALRRYPLNHLKHLSTGGHTSLTLSFCPAPVLATLVALSSITPLLTYHPQASSHPSSLQPDLQNQNSPQPTLRACLECLGIRTMAKKHMKFRCIRYNFYFHCKCSGSGAELLPTNRACPTYNNHSPTFPYRPLFTFY